MSGAEMPSARLKARRPLTLAWMVPLAAIALAAWIVWRQIPTAGPTVSVLVEDAAGIQANRTPVQYLGVTVGRVEEVSLLPPGETEVQGESRVLIRAAMSAEAEPLLREGTDFWVVRPQIGLSSLQELDTLISGPYLALQPGEGPPSTDFVALDQAPGPGDREGGINLVLNSKRLGPIGVGTPISYRGVQVGEVYQYSLTEDARGIRHQAHIYEGYEALVREDSVFWNSGGLDMELSMFGAEVSADSLSSVLLGGITLAVPDSPGEAAEPFTEFTLYGRPRDEWSEWDPAIEIRPRAIRQSNSPGGERRLQVPALEAGG